MSRALLLVIVALVGCRDYAHFDRLPDAGPRDLSVALSDGSPAADAALPPSVCPAPTDLGALDGPSVTIAVDSVAVKTFATTGVVPVDIRYLRLGGPTAATDALALAPSSAGGRLIRIPDVLGQRGAPETYVIDQPGDLFAAGVPLMEGTPPHVVVADAPSGTATDYFWNGSGFGVSATVAPKASSDHLTAILVATLFDVEGPQLLVGKPPTPPSTATTLDVHPRGAGFIVSIDETVHYSLDPLTAVTQLAVLLDRTTRFRAVVALQAYDGSSTVVAHASILRGIAGGFAPAEDLGLVPPRTRSIAVADIDLDGADDLVFAGDDGLAYMTAKAPSVTTWLETGNGAAYAPRGIDWNEDGAADLFAYVASASASGFLPTLFQNRGGATPKLAPVALADANAALQTSSPERLRSPDAPECGAQLLFVDGISSSISIFHP